jgi:hypothetical protein
MLKSRLQQAGREFSHIKNIITGTNSARDGFAPYGLEGEISIFESIDHTYWKAFDHCAVMVQCYATFERFVLSTVNEWIKWCLAHRQGLILNNKNAKDLYEGGIAEILRRKTELRFSYIDRGQLNKSLSYFYEGVAPVNANLLPYPFFATQPNLKLQNVVDLFKCVGIGDPVSWIAEFKDLKVMRLDEGYHAENELRNLVERRNEAAHGNELPSDILGHKELLNTIQIIEYLCRALHDFVLLRMVQEELGVEYEKGKVGTATSLWPRSGAFELTSEENATISCGMLVGSIASGHFSIHTIKSIQIEGMGAKHYYSNRSAALGVTSENLPKKGSKIVALDKVRGFLTVLS